MKHTQKLLAFLLAAAIGLGLCVPAMAQEPLAFDEAPAIAEEVLPEAEALIEEQGIPETKEGIWSLIKAFFLNPSAAAIDAIVFWLNAEAYLPSWAISLIVNVIILPLFPTLSQILPWMGRILVILGLFDIGPILFA